MKNKQEKKQRERFVWDHTENINGWGGRLFHCHEQNLGAPIRGLAESGYPPPTYMYTISGCPSQKPQLPVIVFEIIPNINNKSLIVYNTKEQKKSYNKGIYPNVIM